MPSIQPLNPMKLSLEVQPSSRDKVANKDEYMINGYIEKDAEEGTIVFKRPGYGTGPAFTSPSMGGQGLHFSPQFGLVYAAGSSLYAANGTSLGSIAVVGPYVVTFDDYGGGGTGFLVNIASATGLLYYYNGTLNSVTVPTTHIVPGTVYLNGTLYVMDAFTNIQGSNINDPSTWNLSNRIVASANAEPGVYLAKQKVYVVAFMNNSTQVFYNNPANTVGSPLSVLPGGQASIGCADPWSVQTTGDEIFWVGQSDGLGLGVYMMKDLAIKKVSTGAVDRILSNGWTGAYGFFQSYWSGCPGHRFYIVSPGGQNPAVGQPFSLAYDMETGAWSEWQTATMLPMPYISAASNLLAPYLAQHVTSGSIFEADINNFQDPEGIFTVTIVTENFDGGIRYRKTLGRIDIVTDQVPGSTISISWSADDYQTFSTPRVVDLSANRPTLVNCGTFHKRAYKIVHQANTEFRIADLLMYLQPGSR